MTDIEITKAKFQTCLHSSMTKIGVFFLYKKNKLEEFDRALFTKMMMKKDLEEYDTLLFEYFCDILETNALNTYSYNDVVLDEEPDEFRLELLKVYQFLHRREKDLTDSVTINKSQTHTLINEQLIFEIEKCIDNLFKNYFRETDSSTSNIELLIREFDSRLKHKDGANPKNQHLTILAAEIGDLLRINRFIDSKTINDIDQIKLTSKDRKFIYECMSFWGFIDPQNKSPQNNYIRTIFDQGAKFFPQGYLDSRRMKLAELKTKINSSL